MKMNIRHKTCLIVTLFIATISVFAFQCPTNKECNCTTWENSTEIYWDTAIKCNTLNNNSVFEIYVRQQIQYIEITCINSSDFNLDTTLRTYTEIFNYCNLPNNIKLSGILRKLADQLTKKNLFLLSFALATNLTLRKHHLDNFKKLEVIENNNISYMDKNLLTDVKELLYLLLYNNNLQHLDVEFFKYAPHLRVLVVIENFKLIKPSTFDKLENLIGLTLEHNYLTELQLGTFDKLIALRGLYISLNLVSLPKDIFRKLKNLEAISLQHSRFISLPRDLLRNNTKLSYVDLSRNQNNLTLLSGFLSNLTNLVIVKLHNNGLITLPEDLFWGSFSIKTISLNNNYLQFLYVNIFRNLTELQTLRLNSNNLKDLPDNIFLSTNRLQILNLSNNRFTSISRQLFNGLYLLEELNMEKNYLTTVSKDSFILLEKLKIIYLSDNHLKILPDFIFSNTKLLKTLNLSNNCLTNISDYSLYNLRDLEELNMERNNLKTIPQDSFSSLRNVKIIKLSNNNLTLQENDKQLVSPFNYCNQLKELYLINNSISKIFHDWIIGRQLHILNLSYNNISSVEAKDLLFSSDNIIVDLTHNNIQHINLYDAKYYTKETSTNRKKSNVKILMEYNPLRCNCDLLYNLLRYNEGKMHNVQSYFQIEMRNLICHNPKEMEKERIGDLNSINLTCRIRNTDSITMCPEKCDCFLKPHDKTFIFDCSNKNLTSVPSDIKEPNISSIQIYTRSIDSISQFELNFSYNILMHMPNLRTMKLGLVKKLILSHNNISEISFDGLSTTIKILELHNNNLSRIHPNVLRFWKNSINLTHLTLHENPWECNCDAAELLNFTQTKYQILPEVSKMMCYREKKFISEMTFNDFCPFDTTMIFSSNAAIATAITTAIALVGLIFGLYYKFQTNIKVWLFAHQWCLWFVTEEELDKDKLYDAFVSFSHKDSDFVENELVPKLESGPTPFKLCLHYRDWLAGEFIPDNIARSVENSRRTIVVLSPNFLESVWGRMEFRAAHCQALNEGRARVILILYGDVELTDNLDPDLKAYISMNTYVQWGDPWFWNKLRYALPHQPKRSTHSVQRAMLENYEL